MKIRIKFERTGPVKFLGHLDLMRYFQKEIRRAGIDVCYSTGFSPHQIMSFAAPLGVGITSEGEYFDIEVNSTMSSEDAIKAMNDVSVDGIRVTGYVKLPDDAKTAMSIVAAADYRLSFKEGIDSIYDTQTWANHIKELFDDAASFIITKKTKKSEKEVDLKPLVYDFHMEDNLKPIFYIKLSTGSVDNIKPELVLSSIFERLGLEFDKNMIAIHRIDVYSRDESDNLIPLLEMGQTI